MQADWGGTTETFSIALQDQGFEIALTLPTDERSINRHLMDGYTLCGERKLSFIDTVTGEEVVLPGAVSGMSFYYDIGGLLYVYPTQVGSWQFDISFGLLNYPHVAHTASIQLDLTVYNPIC